MITQLEIQKREIRALSIKQPFASLMFLGKCETRSFKTSYRGLVLIAASQAGYPNARIRAMMGSDAIKDLRNLIPYPCGMAIGIGRLVDCRPLQHDDPHFIQWHPGWSPHFAWVFEDVTPIVQFGYKGQLGMPRITQATREMIKVLDRGIIEHPEGSAYRYDFY